MNGPDETSNRVTVISKEIITACLHRDKAAFKTLVEQYTGFAFSAAFRILNDEDESKDVIQETFITVWTKIKSYDPAKDFTNWFYRILVNKCYDALRKRKRRHVIYPDKKTWDNLNLSSNDNHEIKLENTEIAGIIRSLTGKLSPRQKIVFILSELEGLSHQEISEITDMPKTTIKSNLNHARKKIREMIEIYI